MTHNDGVKYVRPLRYLTGRIKLRSMRRLRWGYVLKATLGCLILTIIQPGTNLFATEQPVSNSQIFSWHWQAQVAKDYERRKRLVKELEMLKKAKACANIQRFYSTQFALEECRNKGIGSGYEDGCKEYVEKNWRNFKSMGFRCDERNPR